MTDRESLTREIKEANDIVAVVGNYLPLRPAGQTFKGLCPFHNDTRPSFDVDPRRQRFKCWSCGKFGDVFTFVQEMEKVDFLEARSILARKAGISLEAVGPNPAKVKLLEVMRWACEKYQECLLDSPLAEAARVYVGERLLTGATVRSWGLGFAPLAGDWLVNQAAQDRITWETLLEVGLIAERKERGGYYDRFRDRVMFPIRDARGQTVGFGGRILPTSPYASRVAKYYNSSETPLFNKSELLYGIDKARLAAASCGYLAVVEGYTDVVMSHQLGVSPVVATMGTALNARHIAQLRRFVPRVVLVYDADAGGIRGVDRALELFVSQDVELAVATLPDQLDPWDLLVQQGPEAFKKVLTEAIDALDFKLNQLLLREGTASIEATRRVVDGILGIMALAPEMPGQSGQIKQELLVTRIAHRLGLRQETIWARLGELRSERRLKEAKSWAGEDEPNSTTPSGNGGSGPAPPEERELLEVLLAEPEFVSQVAPRIRPDDLTHPGLRRLLDGLYTLQASGMLPDIDGLRIKLNHPALIHKAMQLQEVGRMNSNRIAWLTRLLAVFERKRTLQEQQTLKDQLSEASDHTAALDLLRQLQQKTSANAQRGSHHTG